MRRGFFRRLTVRTGRYSKLIEDIRNDVTRLEPFFASARIVSDLDRKREKSLGYVSYQPSKWLTDGCPIAGCD